MTADSRPATATCFNHFFGGQRSAVGGRILNFGIFRRATPILADRDTLVN